MRERERGKKRENPYLKKSLAVSPKMLKEQSFPPNCGSQEHDAVHEISRIVQIWRPFPEGSENVQLPFPEHVEPGEE